MGHLGSTIGTLDLAFWFAANGLATTINKYCEFNASLTRSAMGEKCNKITRYTLLCTGMGQVQMCRSLHSEYLRILCLFNDSLLVARKIFHRSPDNNFSAKTKWQKVWLRVQYVVIWYPDGNLPHLYKSCLQKLREICSLNLSKHDLFKWSRFSFCCRYTCQIDV